MKSKLLASMIAATVATVGSVLVAAPASAAVAVYQPAYTDDIYAVSDGTTTQLTLDEWLALGAPAPQPAPTVYVKYSWDDTVYAISTFTPDAKIINSINSAEWARAGWPAPTVAGFIAGTLIYQWGSSPELFAAFPSEDGSGSIHKLTYNQWAKTGFKTPELAGPGFFTLAWVDTPGIAFQAVDQQAAVEISYDEWSLLDFPTPAAVDRIAGDGFFQVAGSADIVYSGPTLTDYTLSYEEWEAAGFPQPEVING
ncbi:hypothetical protein [Nakamurella deserti]|uniref:hypothetical protein n=1 Tax=Nakamurella deserti TaxID=2164074 RepID=UPI000DBE3758|nr:hypothetical protein [Nakamurella deserti]